MTLQPQSEHPHGLSDKDLNVLLTRDKLIIFAFHGNPLPIHELTYSCTNYNYNHIRSFKKECSRTTTFEMVVSNELDRFQLVGNVIDWVPALRSRASYSKQYLRDKPLDHKVFIDNHGDDMSEI